MSNLRAEERFTDCSRTKSCLTWFTKATKSKLTFFTGVCQHVSPGLLTCLWFCFDLFLCSADRDSLTVQFANDGGELGGQTSVQIHVSSINRTGFQNFTGFAILSFLKGLHLEPFRRLPLTYRDKQFWEVCSTVAQHGSHNAGQSLLA